MNWATRAGSLFATILLLGAVAPAVVNADISQPVADTETTDPFTAGGGWTQYLGNGLSGLLTDVGFTIDWLGQGSDRLGLTITATSTGGSSTRTVSLDHFPLVNGVNQIHFNSSTLGFPLDQQFDPSSSYSIGISRILGPSYNFSNTFKVFGSSADTYPAGGTDASGLSDLQFSLAGVSYTGAPSLVVLNHIQGGHIVPVSAPRSGAPVGVDIPYSQLAPVPAGDYYIVVFFNGIRGCPSDDYRLSTSKPGDYWGLYDIQPGLTAVSTAGGGCLGKMHILNQSDADPAWVFGALSSTKSVEAVGDAQGIQAFAVCKDQSSCDALQHPGDVSATPSGPSSVMFLPGIEGTRLYMPEPGCNPRVQNCGETKVWEPSGDESVQNLFLNRDGSSRNQNIYAKDSDIVYNFTVNGHQLKNLYGSFASEMNSIQASSSAHGGTFTWKPIAYDWRLSLPDIVQKGSSINGKVFYEDSTSTPYLVQTLKDLARTSPTGKVTIVAHSNGGLVAKELMYELGDAETQRLIDKVIFVGVPQSGAPQDVGSMLFGYKTALPLDTCSNFFLVGKLCSMYMSDVAGRSFASTSPMGYHLLPSAKYFSDVTDPNHPVVSFADVPSFAKERAAYGENVDSSYELASYLANNDGGRTQPATSDTSNPSILDDQTLINYGTDIHSRLDSWAPPAGVTLYQIAGWGNNTVSGIRFYNIYPFLFGSRTDYQPQFVEDGDKTVPVPSALMIPVSSNVQSYWLNLDVEKKEHADLLESQGLLQYILGLLNNSSILPLSITASRPQVAGSEKYLIYYIHSPVSISVSDSSGNVTGVNSDGSILENVPGSQYGEFGEVKYILVPAGNFYTINLRGQNTGTFALDVVEEQNNLVLASTTFANVPTTPATKASISMTGGISDLSPLNVDEDGNGSTDLVLVPKLNNIVFPPKPVLTVVPDNKSVVLGSTFGTFTSHLEGFLPGDTTSSSVTGNATCTTLAATSTAVGTYAITCTMGTLQSDKYSFDFSNTGVLKIVYRFDGFLQPINDTAYNPSQAMSVFKAGSTVPVKFQVKKSSAAPVQSITAPVWLSPVQLSAMSQSVDETVYADSATSGSTYRWDSVSQQYIYNWTTKGLKSGYWYRIYAQLDDGKTYSVVVGLR